MSELPEEHPCYACKSFGWCEAQPFDRQCHENFTPDDDIKDNNNGGTL